MIPYTAIFIDGQPPNKRETGEIQVKTTSIHFSNEHRTLEIPFSRLVLKVGGNNRELIFFSDKSNTANAFYTSEKHILKNENLQHHPELKEQVNLAKNLRRKLIIATASIIGAFFLFIASLFFFKDALVERLANQIPKSWEKQIGDKLFQTISLQYKFIQNDSLKNELIAVAKPLIRQIEKEGTKVEFYFIKDPSINAFALPGGKVVIQSGLIDNAKSWEEVMGVVSHELAHVTRRHHIRGAINNLGLFVIISTLLGDVTALAGTLVNTGGQLASLSNSRDFETEADETGLSYLQAARINPDGMISFFKTLQKESGSKMEGYMSFLSTHPETGERIKHLQELLKGNRLKYKLIEQDFKQYKQLMNRLK